MRNKFETSKMLNATEINDLKGAFGDALSLIERYCVNLTQEERRAARNVGSRREAYVKNLLRVAQEHENTLPRNIDINEFAKLMEIYEQQASLMVRLNRIYELMDDTQVAIGQELMSYVDRIYGALQSARKYESALDRVVAELEEYNKRFAKETNDQSDNTSNSDSPAD